MHSGGKAVRKGEASLVHGAHLTEKQRGARLEQLQAEPSQGR